jgi:hypothetical protein
MKEFLKKVVEGSRVAPSETCLQSFSQNFEDAISVEWFNRGDSYEAIFYKDNLEHIAMFSLEGTLVEYRLNLPPGYLPEPVRTIVEPKGEMMNAVLRNKGNMLEYEIIYRDSDLKRYMITLSNLGRITGEREL